MDIKIQLPDENTPGILLFLRQIALFQQVLTNPAEASVEEIDEAYGFLLGLIVEPKNRKKAKELLMGLSMAELGGLFEGMTLGEPDPKSIGELRRWMSGKKSADPPYWTPLLLMAKDYGIAPWILEEGLTYKWYKRWLAYRTAESMEQERLEKRGNRGS